MPKGSPAGSEDRLERAKGRALRMLAARSRSEAEVRERLQRAGFEEPVVAQVVAWLHRLGYLDDERFAREWVEARLRSRPSGRIRLAWELRQKGVAPERVEQALAVLDTETEVALAVEAAERRYGGRRGSPEALARQVHAFLLRRGFSHFAVQKAVAHFMKEPDRPV